VPWNCRLLRPSCTMEPHLLRLTSMRHRTSRAARLVLRNLTNIVKRAELHRAKDELLIFNAKF
jgi:hypothetical protein